jgi:hypothetical protein
LYFIEYKTPPLLYFIKNKTQQQLAGVEKGYLALNNIEVGFRNEIPLWLFGLTY